LERGERREERGERREERGERREESNSELPLWSLSRPHYRASGTLARSLSFFLSLAFNDVLTCKRRLLFGGYLFSGLRESLQLAL
jgi:hypothetical protein